MSEMPRLSGKEFLICAMLCNGIERYGLEMVKSSDGELRRGTIYVTLTRMEDKGLVESRLDEHSISPGLPRRLYRVTGVGAATFAAVEAAKAAFSGYAHA